MHVIVAVNFLNILQFFLCELNQKWLSYKKPPFFSLFSFLFWTLFVSAHKHDNHALLRTFCLAPPRCISSARDYISDPLIIIAFVRQVFCFAIGRFFDNLRVDTPWRTRSLHKPRGNHRTSSIWSADGTTWWEGSPLHEQATWIEVSMLFVLASMKKTEESIARDGRWQQCPDPAARRGSKRAWETQPFLLSDVMNFWHSILGDGTLNSRRDNSLVSLIVLRCWTSDDKTCARPILVL